MANLKGTDSRSRASSSASSREPRTERPQSFNGKFRDECLHQHWFLSLLDAQFDIERYRRAFNADRPHEACFPLTPNEYALTFTLPPDQLSA